MSGESGWRTDSLWGEQGGRGDEEALTGPAHSDSLRLGNQGQAGSNLGEDTELRVRGNEEESGKCARGRSG